MSELNLLGIEEMESFTNEELACIDGGGKGSVISGTTGAVALGNALAVGLYYGSALTGWGVAIAGGVALGNAILNK